MVAELALIGKGRLSEQLQPADNLERVNIFLFVLTAPESVMKEAHLNRHRRNRGQTLPAIGFCLMAIMAFGALAVDMGYLDYQHMRMQNATDDAALKAAKALIPNDCPDQTTANTAAQADASLDGFPAGAQINVTVHNPPQAADGPYVGVNCAVSVEINVPQTTTWFLKLFNAPTGMPITTQAVALMENNNPGCIFLLNPSVVSTFTGAKISASSCALLMNDTATVERREHQYE